MNTDSSIDDIQAFLLAKLHASSTLNPDTPVYRIADFFSIARAVESGRLWLTQVSTYSDRNEGIDHLVKALILSAIGEGCGRFGVHDEKSALEQVAEERRCRFVSCWSRNAESHAMWAMYSTDLASIKVQTTVGKLQEMCALALTEHWSKYYFSSDEESRKTLALLCEVDVLPARYEDLQHLLQRLSRRTRLARRLVSDTVLKFDGSKKKDSSFRWRRFMEPSVLKHNAYQYEDEIRVAFRFGWERGLIANEQHDEMVEMFKAAQNGDAEKISHLVSLTKSVRPRIGNTTLSQYSSPIPKGFFESAAVDPRAPAYKRAFIEEFLQKSGVTVTQSTAFGLSYTGLAAYPDKPSL